MVSFFVTSHSNLSLSSRTAQRWTVFTWNQWWWLARLARPTPCWRNATSVLLVHPTAAAHKLPFEIQPFELGRCTNGRERPTSDVLLQSSFNQGAASSFDLVAERTVGIARHPEARFGKTDSWRRGAGCWAWSSIQTRATLSKLNLRLKNRSTSAQLKATIKASILPAAFFLPCFWSMFWLLGHETRQKLSTERITMFSQLQLSQIRW